MHHTGTKSLLKLILVLLILFFSHPALADPFKIEIGPGWVKGHANAIPLSRVLAQVAEKTGYTIYLDQDLQEVPATFSIKADMEPEKAIRRIVHPHSYAVVFGSEADGNGSYIQEVKVFSKGRMHTARYVAFRGETGSAGSGKGGKKNSGSQPSAVCSLETDDPGYASDAGRSLQGKDLLRPSILVKKGAFGHPVIKFRDPRKGPDYRPGAYEMRQSYERFQQAKALEQLQRAQAINRQGQLASKQQAQSYQDEKNGALKQNVKDGNNK